MKVGVVVFPGSNCDRDVHQVLNKIPGMKASFVWHTENNLSGFDCVVIPGGFAFGDRLRAGVIASQSPVVKEVKRLADGGLPILGICNGFQVLVEAGLLPGALIMNQSLRFVCRWTKVKVENTKTPFTCGFQNNHIFNIPVAHGEGRYVSDPATLKRIKKDHQIVLTYVNDDPNGSLESVAAVCNKAGNVMGMMPHPERASNRLIARGSPSDALTIFNSIKLFLSNRAIA